MFYFSPYLQQWPGRVLLWVAVHGASPQRFQCRPGLSGSAVPPAPGLVQLAPHRHSQGSETGKQTLYIILHNKKNCRSYLCMSINTEKNKQNNIFCLFANELKETLLKFIQIALIMSSACLEHHYLAEILPIWFKTPVSHLIFVYDFDLLKWHWFFQGHLGSQESSSRRETPDSLQHPVCALPTPCGVQHCESGRSRRDCHLWPRTTRSSGCFTGMHQQGSNCAN